MIETKRNACLVLLPPGEALACPNKKEKRQGHARRYKTACATSSNSALVLETAKFRPERHLRVSAKYLIHLGGISPPPRLSPRSAPAPRERKAVYHKSPRLWGERFTSEKIRACFIHAFCDWKQLEQLVKTTLSCVGQLARASYPSGFVDGHGRVSPCAKGKLFSTSCFQSGRDKRGPSRVKGRLLRVERRSHLPPP